MTSRAVSRLAIGVVALALVASACGQRNQHDGDTGNSAEISVVASTDVWGSVAAFVAGDHATVKSIESGAAADPHSYEATPSDAAAIADASVVVYNGGGYDHWVDDILAGHSGVDAVDAYSLQSATSGTPPNEHVFYDLATAKAVAVQIADKLAALSPTNADQFHSNAAEFGKQADNIAESERAIGTAHPSSAVVATEPVAYYLLQTAGIADRTPEGFAKAVEEGDDPAPADVAALLDLIGNHQISVLLFNPQTETAATNQISDAARRASIPVVDVTETLPSGKDYLTWQRDTVADLAGQFDKAPPTNP